MQWHIEATKIWYLKLREGKFKKCWIIVRPNNKKKKCLIVLQWSKNYRVGRSDFLKKIYIPVEARKQSKLKYNITCKIIFFYCFLYIFFGLNYCKIILNKNLNCWTVAHMFKQNMKHVPAYIQHANYEEASCLLLVLWMGCVCIDTATQQSIGFKWV